MGASRRTFRRWATGVGTFLTGAMIGIPTLRAFLAPLREKAEGTNWIKVGEVELGTAEAIRCEVGLLYKRPMRGATTMRPVSKAGQLALGATILVTGCTSGMMGTWSSAQLLSVSPRGGAADISDVPDVTLRFDQSMMPGMEQSLVLHRGGLTGPTVPMNCSWSDGQKTLTCRPVQPLESASAYTIHIGGGMMDADGQLVAMGRNGMRIGDRQDDGWSDDHDGGRVARFRGVVWHVVRVHDPVAAANRSSWIRFNLS